MNSARAVVIDASAAWITGAGVTDLDRPGMLLHGFV